MGLSLPDVASSLRLPPLLVVPSSLPGLGTGAGGGVVSPSSSVLVTGAGRGEVSSNSKSPGFCARGEALPLIHSRHC